MLGLRRVWMAGRSTPGRMSVALSAILCLAVVVGGTPGLAYGSAGPSSGRHRAFVAQEGLAGDVIVVLEEGAAVQAAEAVEIAVDVSGEAPAQVFDTVIDGFATTLTAAEVAELATDPQVAGIFPDTPVSAAAQTLPTGVNRVDADQNSTANIDGVDQRVNVGVAVFDSGIVNHSDLNLVGGKDCSGTDTGDFADNFAAGHGTHVAGTIGALDNGSGVVGVAPGASLYAVKVLDGNGNGSASNLICGLNWVAQNAGAIDIVNMSLVGPAQISAEQNACGAPGATTPLHQAVCNVVNGSGVTVVAAAGNQGGDAGNFVPATYPEVITVSGINDGDGQPGGDTRYSASNSGADVDIAAPAVGILSTTLDGGTGIKTGTSMSAAHVSGAIALTFGGWGADIFDTARFPGEAGGVSGVPEGVLCVGSCGGGGGGGGGGTASISLNPTRTTVNVQVRAALSGFPANTSVTVSFLRTSYPSTATVTTNSSGAATAFLRVPATPQGSYTIRAEGGGRRADATFQVAPRIKVTPNEGPRGTTVDVSLRGFGKRDSVRIRWERGNGYSTVTTVTASNSGSANVFMPIPAFVPDGQTSVRGDGTIARAQTNVVFVSGGTFQPAEVTTSASAAGTPDASPVVEVIDASPAASPVDATPVATETVEVTVVAPIEVPTEVPTEAPTEVPTEAPTEIPTEVPAEVPTETPAPTSTPTPEVTSIAIAGDASSDPNVPGWVAYDDDPLTYWEVAAPPPLVSVSVGEGTPAVPEVEINLPLGPDGLPLPAASLVLDLGVWTPIGAVRWLYAFEGGADDLRIEVSDDGVFWIPITYPGQVGNALPGEWQELPLASGTVGGRYVRFAFENPNGDPTLGGLAEVEVWP